MVKIVQLHLDYRYGQHDYVLNAYDENDLTNRIAHLSYRLFEGQPSVNHILVAPDRRNERIGSELVLALQRFYPERCIDFGMSTDDGTGLLASLDWKIVPNENVAAAKREHAKNIETLTRYTDGYDAVRDKSQKEKDAFTAEVADWNDILDRQDELERLIETQAAEFRYAVAAKPMAATLTI
jgi:hypothetical protein